MNSESTTGKTLFYFIMQRESASHYNILLIISTFKSLGAFHPADQTPLGPVFAAISIFQSVFLFLSFFPKQSGLIT